MDQDGDVDQVDVQLLRDAVLLRRDLEEPTISYKLVTNPDTQSEQEANISGASYPGATIVLVAAGPGLRASFSSVSNQFELSWSESGVLQNSGNLKDWVNVENAEAPYPIPHFSGPDVAKFWRLLKSE